MKRFFKKCEEFSICSEIAKSGDYFVDGYPDNITIYHICIKGSAMLAKPFDNCIDIIPNGEIVDTKKYLYEQRLYHCKEDVYIFGFNPLTPDQDWNGKLIKDSFMGNDKSWLICFSGDPIINGVRLKFMDYAKLENKHYDVELNNAIVGVFTKL